MPSSLRDLVQQLHKDTLLALAQVRQQLAIALQQVLQYRADQLCSLARQAHMLRPAVRDTALPLDEPSHYKPIEP